MENQTQTTVRCSGCGQPISANVKSVIDVTQNPADKPRLLSGQFNTTTCPHCGTVNTIATPLLYHDASKELLISFIPMELNMNKSDQERAVGELLNRLPKDNFKGYMFNPKRALTMQGMIEQILEADGITPEMIEAQRQKIRLVQRFLETDEDEDLDALIKEHDAEIDEHFFQALSLMAQRVFQENQPEAAQAILALEEYILTQSSYGQQIVQQQQEQQQVIGEVVEAVRAVSEQPTRADFLDLAIQFLNDKPRLQALVSLGRSAFDYECFQLLTQRIEEASDEERANLETLRERLIELTASIDQEVQRAMQSAAGFLQALVNDPNPEELLQSNLQMVDDAFMSVLSSNIQRAEQAKDIQTLTRLKEIYQMVVSALQQNMGPELRFVNELLSASSTEEASTLLIERAHEFGDALLEMLDAIEEVMEQQGNTAMAERARSLKTEAKQVLT